MNRSQRKQLVREIENSIEDDGEMATILMFVQQKPWTFVEVVYWTETGDTVYGYGFSKVCYPDVFDPGFGRWIATRRAVYDIVEKMEDQGITDVRLPEITVVTDSLFTTLDLAQST